MKINKKTCIEFWERNKGMVITGGAVLLSVVVGAVLLKAGGKDVESEAKAVSDNGGWIHDSKWRDHCDKNNLLLNGLPIFADDDQMIIYKDAIEPGAIKEFEEDGFEIIDRA